MIDGDDDGDDDDVDRQRFILRNWLIPIVGAGDWKV